MNKIPTIALVGNAPQEKYDVLNAVLDDESLSSLCEVQLYGADGQAEREALRDAIDDYQDGIVNGIVCLPTSTPLAELLSEVMDEGAKDVLPIMVNDKSRLAQLTLTFPFPLETLVSASQLLSKALKRDLGILNPRIAVTSLNEEISTEEGSAEITTIAPAVSELVKQGVQAFGPIAYKKVFEGDDYTAFDAVMQMKQGQCDEAFRALSDETPVMLMTGIEVPIAQTEAEGLIHAIGLVMDAERNRKAYDEPFENPLPKLYHEKKEDGDKARFAVKKKGFNPAEHRRENVTYITANNPAQDAENKN